MSRSYKHHPHCKCETSCKKGKRWANKKVRQHLKRHSIPKGCTYQKVFNSYEIAAYKKRGEEPTQEDWYSWYKFYKMK